MEWNETDTEAEDTTDEGGTQYRSTGFYIVRSYDKVIDGTDANKGNVIKLKHNLKSI